MQSVTATVPPARGVLRVLPVVGGDSAEPGRGAQQYSSSCSLRISCGRLLWIIGN